MKEGGNCFEKNEPRKILWDAKQVSEKKYASAIDFENVENRYRQFKKNFEEKRDWESAGDFYHGEMLMRLFKYSAERREKSWGFSWWNPLRIWYRLFHNRWKTSFLRWYKWISDFNESPARAMVWLIGIVVVFSVVFILLFQNQLVINEVEQAISFGFTGAIPLYNLPQQTEQEMFDGDYGWIIKVIYYAEVFFSTIVWALLILSVRQKFKR